MSKTEESSSAPPKRLDAEGEIEESPATTVAMASSTAAVTSSASGIDGKRWTTSSSSFNDEDVGGSAGSESFVSSCSFLMLEPGAEEGS